MLLQKKQMHIEVSGGECKKEVNGKKCILSVEYYVQFQVLHSRKCERVGKNVQRRMQCQRKYDVLLCFCISDQCKEQNTPWSV